MKKEIFLDGASNTPLDKAVFNAMKPYLSSNFVGNSSSAHDFGRKADIAIYQARKDIAEHLCVQPDNVYFTSGATESNNWAIKSIAYDQLYKNGGKKHIICSATEHDSVLNCCKQLEEIGMFVEYVHPKDKDGAISVDDVLPLIRADTCMICLMAINNETGVANNVNSVAKYAKEHGIKTLVDCTQLLSYGGQSVEIGKRYPDATFFSFSAHKIYGPLGVGCLISTCDDKLNPLIVGGSQEKGLRGGTSNTTGIIGMAAAIAAAHELDCSGFFKNLLTYLECNVMINLYGVRFNARPTHANIVSLNCSSIISADNLASELAIRGIAVSAGSACNAEHDETQGDFNGSHVLKELGLSEQEIRNTIRISFTKYTTLRDIDKLIETLKEIKQDADQSSIR